MSQSDAAPSSSAEPAPPTLFRPTLRQILSRSFWAGADWGRVARPSRLDEVSRAADDFADRELPKIERLPVALSPVQEEATCPDCKSVLSRIVRPEGNTLSDEAFSREYGDWRCDTCPPNNATWHHYRVFWNNVQGVGRSNADGDTKAALDAARHALTVSHGLTATDKPLAYEDAILHDGCDAIQARDVQREVSWKIDNSKEIAMIDAVSPLTHICPPVYSAETTTSNAPIGVGAEAAEWLYALESAWRGGRFSEDVLQSLHAALPALLEASRDLKTMETANDELEQTIYSLHDQLRGSISERETLTADRDAWINAHAEAIGHMKRWADELERIKALANGTPDETAEAAVARLTTENSQLRNDVANAERDVADIQIRLLESKRRSEQVIQDIEALPTFVPTQLPEVSSIENFGMRQMAPDPDLQQWLRRSAVLLILREAPNT